MWEGFPGCVVYTPQTLQSCCPLYEFNRVGSNPKQAAPSPNLNSTAPSTSFYSYPTTAVTISLLSRITIIVFRLF